MKQKIGFVTYQDQPEITADDALAEVYLAKCDIEIIGTPWDEVGIDWTSFDAVVIRSCWNYFHHSLRFLSWIDALEQQGVNLLNRPAVLRWNVEKIYLQALELAGIDIVPTIYAPKHSFISVSDTLREQGWERAAIKPTISGTSLHTWVSSLGTSDYDQRKLDHLLRARNMMLQKYLPEIETEGELSLIFFDGKYSHAVKKVPCKGDFRVQSNFGGTWTAVDPEGWIRSQATEVLHASGWDPVYARVDGVVHEGAFLLMELELIEPHLFLQSDQAAPERFANALRKRLVDQDRKDQSVMTGGTFISTEKP